MKTNAALAGLQQKNCMAVSRLIVYEWPRVFFLCAGGDVLAGVANIEFSDECVWRCLRAVINLRASWWSESRASEVEQARVQTLSGGENKTTFPENDNKNRFCAKAKSKKALRFHCQVSQNGSYKTILSVKHVCLMRYIHSF